MEHGISLVRRQDCRRGKHDAGDSGGARESVEKGLALAPVAAGQPAPWLRRQLEDKLEQLKKFR